MIATFPIQDKRAVKHSDRPISSLNDDLLSRGDYASHVAMAIFNMNAPDGFVMALTGEWGSGKTSIIQIITRCIFNIELSDASNYLVKTGQINQTYSPLEIEYLRVKYRQLEIDFQQAVLDGKDASRWEEDNIRSIISNLYPKENEDESIFFWRLYRHSVKYPKNIIFKFSPWIIGSKVELSIAFLTQLSRSINLVTNERLSKSFAGLIERISELNGLAGASVTLATGSPPIGLLTNSLLNYTGILAKKLTGGETIERSRDKVIEALSNLPQQKILVIVDDIDRLSPEETVELLSLVKGMGNLPNIVYLLTYDEELVVNSLKSEKFDGAQYLKKIVQFSFSVPIAGDEDMSGIFNDALISILGEQTLAQFSNEIGRLWHYFFQKIFKNIRDIRRISNIYAFNHSALREYTHPIDLLIIESIRVYMPKLYVYIRENIMELSSPTQNSSIDIQRTEIGKVASEEEALSEPAKFAISFLFPRLASALHVFQLGADEKVYRDPHRIANSNYCLAYFSFTRGLSDFSASKMDEILSLNPFEALDKITDNIIRYEAQERPKLVRMFLHILENKLLSRNSLSIGWFSAIMSKADFFTKPTEWPAGPVYDRKNYVARASDRENFNSFVATVLASLDVHDRSKYIVESLEFTGDLTSICNVMYPMALAFAFQDASRLSGPLALEAFAVNTFTSISSAIRKIALSGAFWRQDQPTSVMWMWKLFEQQSVIRSFLDEQIDIPEALPFIAEMVINTISGTSGFEYYIELGTWKPLVDLQKLESKVREAVDGKSASSSDISNYLRFMQAISGPTSDKPT